MSIEREERDDVRRVLSISRVECDRCHREIRPVHAPYGLRTDWPYGGVLIRGVILPDAGNAADIEQVNHELCSDCTRVLSDGSRSVRGLKLWHPSALCGSVYASCRSRS